MCIAVKGGQKMKLTNIPVIILSNFSISGCYSKCEYNAIEPLMVRFTVVEVVEFIKLLNTNGKSWNEDFNDDIREL